MTRHSRAITARSLTRALAKLSAQHDELEAKRRNLSSALDAPQESPYDSALDVYNELRARVAGAQAHGESWRT